MPTYPFQILAIPLNRPRVIDQLMAALNQPTSGARLNVLAQRPTPAARRRWVAGLRQEPTLHQFLQIHQPQNHVVPAHTNALVPAQFLQEPGFLTRNMGGWSPLYFGVGQWVDGAGAGEDKDALRAHTAVLQTYGDQINYLGPDEAQVQARLVTETGMAWTELCPAILHLAALREAALPQPDNQPRWPSWARYAERVYRWLERGGNWSQPMVMVQEMAVPRLLLLDELLHFLVLLEVERRTAVLSHNQAIAGAITAWQERFTAVSKLFFILKGEYIMGRHRRSTIMLLPELGLVVKQPGLEPLHEVQIGAQTYDGRIENWPHLLEDGALVTAAGRIRLILEDGLIPHLNHVFGLKVLFSSLLGLSIEPHISGPTLQEYIWVNPDQLTLDFYQQIILHQQVCEQLQVENGDWHAANFMVAEKSQKLTHIDWGAARPLLPHEMNETEAQARLHQVKNIAYSFNDEALATRTEALHAQLVQNDALLAAVRQEARGIVMRAE